jgi:hypothetical protein
MTGPAPHTSGRTTTTRRLLGPLLAIVVGGIIFGWLVARPPDRQAQIELCRTKYAAARTHGDTIRVDAFSLGGGRFQPHTFCSDYRFTGMR